MLQKISVFMILIGVMLSARAEVLPSDVVRFIEKRDLCDHFRGEYPEPDAWGEAYQERLDEVNIALKENCAGTDKELIQLRVKYQQRSNIIDKLKDYDDCLEPTSCHE